MSKKWEDLIREKVSPELEHKTMVRVRQELEKNQTLLAFVKYFLPSFAGGVLLVFLAQNWMNLKSEVLDDGEEFLAELSDLSSEELEELDEELVAELEFFEEFELLEGWDGREDV